MYTRSWNADRFSAGEIPLLTPLTSNLELVAPAAGETQGPDSGEKGLDASPASVHRYGETRAEVQFSKDGGLQHQSLVESKRHRIPDY